MYATTYHRPSSVDEAAALFTKGSEPKYLAGGHTLIPVMKQRLAAPSDVIDLGKIKDLIGIEVAADTLTIKAATTHYDVAASGPVQKAIPALAHLASLIGDPAVVVNGGLEVAPYRRRYGFQVHRIEARKRRSIGYQRHS